TYAGIERIERHGMALLVRENGSFFIKANLLLSPDEPSEQPTEPSTEPEFGAGSLDPVKFEARKEEFINSLRGHGYNPPSIEDDLARAMEEYGLFNSTLYVADLDLSAFHYLTFSETVLKDAAFTRECRIELAERMGSFFPYVETYLQYNKIEYRGDRVYMDLQVWFLIEYARPGASVSDIMTVGIDHQVVLQRQNGGTFLLASDSFDETSVGRAHSSDR
ncbi:MAG: hypothetical protein IKY02_01730, partial [Lachnospiraceae bacterium]|nr:hypothetical protein [Lachnospiraceae bacterium]